MGVFLRQNLLAKITRNAIYEPISPVPLALFRIAFSMILLAEVFEFFSRSDLIYLESPLESTVSPKLLIAIGVWAASVAFLMLGMLTRVVAWINYLFVVAFLSPTSVFEYHADLLYVPGSLLVALLPVNRTWSIDSIIIKKIWRIDLSRRKIPRCFNNVTIYLLLGLVYFDSTFFKMASEFWCRGLGLWFPASFPGMTTCNWNLLLNQEWFVKSAGYITLVFEAVFVFLFWVPRIRAYLFLIGVVLHVGIAIVFPIPLFGLAAIAVYILFFPDHTLARCVSFVPVFRGCGYNSKGSTPMEAGDVGFLKSDKILCNCLVALAVVVTVVQISLIARVPVCSNSVYLFLNKSLGVQRHHVFGEIHFPDSRRELALVYYDNAGSSHWIPWLTEDGYADSECYGRFWVLWLRISASAPEKQQEWCAKVAESWAKRVGVSLYDGFVIVKSRRSELRRDWERDRYEMNRKMPWNDRIKITWSRGDRHFEPIASQSRAASL